MTERAKLDCSRCFHKACCHVFSVNLTTEEIEDKKFETETDEIENTYLKRVNGGACVYLIDGACSIHDCSPKVCQTWSCEEDHRFPVILEMYLSGKDKQTS